MCGDDGPRGRATCKQDDREHSIVAQTIEKQETNDFTSLADSSALNYHPRTMLETLSSSWALNV